MTTATLAELALDQDLALVSYRLCLQAREIQIGKLQQMAQGADHIFQDPHGNPTLSVRAGEGTYVFQCTKVPTILRASYYVSSYYDVTAIVFLLIFLFIIFLLINKFRKALKRMGKNKSFFWYETSFQCLLMLMLMRAKGPGQVCTDTRSDDSGWRAGK